MELKLLHRLRCSAGQHRYCPACQTWECSTSEHTPTYEIPQVTALLTFEDTAYAGATVRVLLNPRYDVLPALEGAVDEQAAQRIFGDALIVDWNLSRDGIPIPCDGHHFVIQPYDFCELVLRAWRLQMSPEPATEPSGDELPVFDPAMNGKPPEELDLSEGSTELVHASE